MIEYVLKKPYDCEMGTLHKGASIRIMCYDGRPVIYYDGGMVEGRYSDILLRLIKDKRMNSEYVIERSVIDNKV